jgi:rubrerythrin
VIDVRDLLRRVIGERDKLQAELDELRGRGFARAVIRCDGCGHELAVTGMRSIDAIAVDADISHLAIVDGWIIEDQGKRHLCPICKTRIQR